VSATGKPGDRRLRVARPIQPDPAIEPCERMPAEAATPVELADVGAVTWEATIASRRGRRDYWLRRALACSDMLAITLALSAAFLTSPEHSVSEVIWLLPVLPGWVLLFALYGLYGRDVKRISHGVLDDLPWLFHALLLGSLALWIYCRVIPPNQLVLQEVVVFGIAALVLALTFRWLIRRLAISVFGPERVLLIGRSAVTPALIRKMRTHPEYAMQAIGIVCGDGTPGNGAQKLAPGVSKLGSLADADLLKLVELHHVERVIVAQEEVEDELLFDLFRRCSELAVKISLLPRGIETIGPSTEVDDIEGVPVLGLNQLVLSRSGRIVKRLMDIVGASLALLLCSPVMVLAAVAVKLTSRGSVFFRQERIGRLGRSFSLFKFRTMVDGADSRTEELMHLSEDPHWLKLTHDPRVTPVGRFLRLTSVDELPQLFNVLAGEMSLVGPRPLTSADHAQIQGWARIRLDLAPGITGLWQVLGRTSIPFEEMVKLDYVYVTNWSMWMDLRLLLKTVPVVIRRRGAN
jgi:exopolysaccharide biosynthesis polyprenyl glycosylphosphotransferase